MTIDRLNESRNQARMTTVERLQAASIPAKLRPQYQTILTAAKNVDKLLNQFNNESDKITSNTDFSSEGRTRQLNDLVAKYKELITEQAATAQAAYETALEGFNNAHKDFTPTSSDVLLADASTRLHFMVRNVKYVSENTFVDFYRNAVVDGDTALSELIRLNFKSIVRQYVGEAAKNPERLFLETLPKAEQSQYTQALQTMDVAPTLRQKIMYNLN